MFIVLNFILMLFLIDELEYNFNCIEFIRSRRLYEDRLHPIY